MGNSTREIARYHKQRRIFCVHEDRLYIAEKNLTSSHLEWFSDIGILNDPKDKSFEKIVRGYLSKDGDIYFYIGSNFKVNKSSEEIFFSKLKELIKELNIENTAKIYGGMHVGKKGEGWKPLKEYGLVGEFLN